LTPGDLKSAGIPEKALRSAKPEYAKDEKDLQAKDSPSEKILSETHGIRSTLDGVFPGFGPQPDVQYPEYITVPLPQASIKRLSEKICEEFHGRWVDTSSRRLRNHYEYPP